MSTALRSVKPEIAASIALCPISLAAMGMLIKAVSGVPESVLLLARFGVPAVIYWGLLGFKRYRFRNIRPHKHLLRAVLGFLSVSSLFAAIARIPLSTALCLSYTLPFFAYAIAVATRRERLDARASFVIGALIGVACMIDPSAHADVAGIAFGLASALFGAIALYEIKRVARSEDSDAVLLMYFTISTIGLALYVLLFDASILKRAHAMPWPMLTLIGVCGLLYQIGLVTSLKEVSVSLVSMFLLLSVAISFVGDRLLFASAFTFIGTTGLLVLAASILCFQYFETAKRRHKIQ